MINDYIPFSNRNSHYVYIQYVCDKICCPNQIYNMGSMTNHMCTEHLCKGSLRIPYDITEKNGGSTGTKATTKFFLFL